MGAGTITGIASREGGVTGEGSDTAVNGPVVNELDHFDLRVAFGTTRIDPADVRSATFDLAGPRPLILDQFS